MSLGVCPFCKGDLLLSLITARGTIKTPCRQCAGDGTWSPERELLLNRGKGYRKVRLANKLTLRKAADACGLRYILVSDIEQGYQANVTDEEREKYKNFIGGLK